MKKIPIGVDDFKKLISDNYFYIDKTKFIEDIVNDGQKLNFLPVPEDLEKLLICPCLKTFLI